ncbi:MAG: DUF1501 domain-containing protein [Pirellulaceae bacterium]|nr:DUF1501 domain-containing protein [Planctomycetales bacterium]MCA9265266.1 DUF1501 domain-containing protein [Planctomycetales bacterium]
MNRREYSCGSSSHWSRRTFLQATGLGGMAWLSPLAQVLAEQQETTSKQVPAQSVILLWLGGGPSQLETFDPHPDTKIAGGTTAVETRLPGVQFAAGLPQLADVADDLVIVRNVVSREGDHERAAYNVKTGYRPDTTLVHPALGAVICHQLPRGKTDIPRHVSLLPDQWYGRGGYLGPQYDAFRTYDTTGQLPDVHANVDPKRLTRRLDDLSVVEQAFAKGRINELELHRTQHRAQIDDALRIMESEQLQAFDVRDEPARLQRQFGNTEFGRACLVALRLIQVGVRCVEVTLSGWDSHVNNHEIHANLNSQLDPAMSALIGELKQRDLFDSTVVVCAGEFGRTPEITPGAEGRGHWPHGFSMAMAGGKLRRGTVLGETSPDGTPIAFEQGTPIADIHATVLQALGIDPATELITPVGRPLKLSEGKPIRELLTG